MSQTAVMECSEIVEHPDISRIKGTIHNPNDSQHYMKLKPVSRRVRISRGYLAFDGSKVRIEEIGDDAS